MFLNSLSGRFLLLTLAFVMLAEVLIFVPSVARNRMEYLRARLERAQIASLVIEADPMISPDLEREVLETAGVYNVVLRRDEVRQLMLSSPIPSPVDETFDLRRTTRLGSIRDALRALANPRDRVIRIIGSPTQDAGILIEVTMAASGLREAMLEYGLRVLGLSAVISVLTAALLFFAVRRILVKPIRGVVEAMQTYAAAPEDARRIIVPTATVRELRDAEAALQGLQTDLTTALRQKDRLAQLGGAVAKISHDLRNILTTAQLFADRLEGSVDPAVARMAPKLLASISRAVHLCEATMTFGRAEEPPPLLDRVRLSPIVTDVIEAETLAAPVEVEFANEVPPGLTLRADAEQLYRVLTNLVRNARQAIEAAGSPGIVTVAASEDDIAWRVTVADTGPGLPPKARDNLFRAFQGGARKGGSGLGLAIAADLVRGHGGRLDLVRTDASGTIFAIELPKAVAALDAAAE